MRALREGAGLTQQRLADRLQVRASTISEIESGAVSPTLTTAGLLARTLGVSLAELVKFNGETVTQPDGADEAALLEDYRRLSEEGRAVVRSVARGVK